MMNEDDFQHRTHLAYLLNRVTFLLRDNMTAALQSQRLTFNMWRALVVLYNNGEQTIGALVSPSSLEQSTLSRTLASLIRRQLVSRKAGADDGRMVLVGLTTKGATLVEKLIPQAMSTYAVLMDGVNDPDAARLREILVVLNDNMTRDLQDRETQAKRRRRTQKKTLAKKRA
jgi:DNA-binding MarR family transcriptional regulator